MPPETAGPVHGEAGGRVAGQDMRLAHNPGERPEQPPGSDITRSVSSARRLRDKVTGLTATVRLSTERPYVTALPPVAERRSQARP
jgi:hypothetical protein